ncbi:amino acid/amide ABC transporter membrane protein 1 (HAAT family) [Acidovorax sp. 99]|uniref:branched-chain amino acid ABC transporter permease n=1 Tax=unclassified Acidovorax TaxID=2684926 RepID=UPI000A8E5164|nr:MULTISPECIES: branched-chain amino acid ABC transporter permease [unclassified Acidovorax]MBN9628003.1 branched-chain amino acid ABC transporter permease [Acidovorax sp.]PTT36737.1 branched-chain amino acid ABC transporter permease [Acidovorax sp. HMWF018]PVY89605.1 amino acid/amide ABC transporter membrane protein 1 (HAAT family) [Acidovorax sp. 99]
MSNAMEWLQFVLAPQMINGLSIGVAVVLMALGLTIIFGLLDVINMAHGEFYAIGAYLAVALLATGMSFWWALVLTPLLMAVLGFVTERGLIQRVFHSKDRHTLTLLLTFGVAVVLEDALKIAFGANPLRLEAPISGATEMLGLFFPNYRLFVMLFGGALIAGVWLLVFRTSLGAIVRAAAYDRNMSASLGVPVQLVYAGTFAFGVALAGIAGVLLAPIYSVFPTMGKDFVLIAFSVVIIGGMGSIKGALLAGLLLTQVQSISSLYISPVWSDPLLFGIMVLVLMWRPQGLFGKLGSA